MKNLESKIKDIQQKTAEITAGLGKSASPEAIRRAKEAIRYRKTDEGRASFVHSTLSDQLTDCCGTLILIYLFGIVLAATGIAALLLLISTTISLAVFRHSNAKYLYAGVAALVILGLWAGTVYKFFDQPRTHFDRKEENWKKSDSEYLYAVKKYEDAVKKFELRDAYVTSENENNVFNGLRENIIKDFELRDVDEVNSRSHLDSSEY